MGLESAASADQGVTIGVEEPSARRATGAPQGSDGADGYGAVIRWEQRRRLWGCLKQLERSQRRLVLGRVLLQRSWRELGQQLGLSGKVSERRCRQALEQLRQRLQESDDSAAAPARAGAHTRPKAWASAMASTAASRV